MIEDGIAAFASSLHYCEPVGFGFIKQPINVLGNLGFLLAFFYAKKLIGFHHLTLVTLLIFLGSSLWHIGLHPMGLVFDIVPIFLWLILFLWTIGKYHIKASHRVAMICAYLLILSLVSKTTTEVFPMSSGVFVAIAFTLFIIGYSIYNINRNYSYLFIYSCFLLNIAIIARIGDIPFCNQFSYGTHWIWHAFAGFSLLPLIKLVYLLEKKYSHKELPEFYLMNRD